MKIELEKSRKGYFMEAYQNKLLLVEVKDNVALVTLNNPPLNILTLEVSAEMRDTLHKLEEDEDCLLYTSKKRAAGLICNRTCCFQTEKWKSGTYRDCTGSESGT